MGKYGVIFAAGFGLGLAANLLAAITHKKELEARMAQNHVEMETT